MVETTPYQPISLTFVQKDRSHSGNTTTQNSLGRLHEPDVSTTPPSAASNTWSHAAVSRSMAPGDRLLRYVMLIGGEQRQRDPHSRRPLRICK